MSDTTVLEDVDSVMEELGAELEDDEVVMARVMLATAMVGPSGDKVARALGITRSVARHWVKVMREKGIAVGHRVEAGWGDEHGGLEFILDVGVMKGVFERISE